MSKDQELKLISKLKKLCVQFDDGKKQKWKEVEGKISVAAEIFRKLGLIYMKRNSSQRCIIQSAALFMAAQVRKYHEQTEKDLEKLWCTVQEKAGNKKKIISLNSVSRKIKKNVHQMRLQTKRSVNQLPMLEFDMPTEEMHKSEKEKIKNIKRIQKQLFNSYTNIMKDVAKSCLEILAKPQCKFALIGMGSLARKEVTPYSDFECFILLEEGVQFSSHYKSLINYFKWLAVIFQIILISLGETILPAVAIPSLNDFYKLYKKRDGDWFYDDYTPKGISFDGFIPHASKTPLGESLFNDKPETALIKPVSEMVKHLSTKEEVLLTETCFVFGDESLHYNFLNIAVKELEKQRGIEETCKSFHKQMFKDFNKFNLQRDLGLLFFLHTLDIKKAFYRMPTIFLSQYSNYLGFPCFSSFETISKLQKEKYIPKDLEHQLKYVVAITCEARLKAYNKQRRQEDKIKLFSLNDKDETLICNLVGEKCVVDFFKITMGLIFYSPSFSLLEKNKYFIENDTEKALFYECLVTFLLRQFERYWLSLPNYLNELETKNNCWERDEALCISGMILFLSHEETEVKKIFANFVLKHCNAGNENSLEANKDIYSVYCNCTNMIENLWGRTAANFIPFEYPVFLQFLNGREQFINAINNAFSEWIKTAIQNNTIQNSFWIINNLKHLFSTITPFYLAVQELRLDKKREWPQLSAGGSKHNMITRKRTSEVKRLEQLQVKKQKT